MNNRTRRSLSQKTRHNPQAKQEHLSRPPTSPTTCHKSPSILTATLLLLLFCYAVQIFTPLRLNTDAITLLSIAEAAANGRGFLDDGAPTVFPPGYPALLALMLRLGIASSTSIVAANLFFLLVGVLALYSVLYHSFSHSNYFIRAILVFSLLSFVFVKHFPIPLTDVPFFGVASCCLAAGTKAAALKSRQPAYIAWLILSSGLAFLATQIRWIGVALLPMLLWVLLSHSPQSTRQRQLHGFSRRYLFWFVLPLASSLAIFLVSKISILGGFSIGSLRKGVMNHFRQVIYYRFTEIGELAVNVPKARLPAAAEFVLPLFGCAVLLIVIAGTFALRRRKNGGFVVEPVDVYVACYAGILFLWPFYDTRFWLPILPMVVAYAASLSWRLSNSSSFIRIGSRGFFLSYITIFVLAGVIAHGYSTMITFSGSEFPNRYGNGSLRSTYCVAWNLCEAKVGYQEDVNTKALRLLKIYR